MNPGLYKKDKTTKLNRVYFRSTRVNQHLKISMISPHYQKKKRKSHIRSSVDKKQKELDKIQPIHHKNYPAINNQRELCEFNTEHL